jgi:hypothetical protein
MSIHEKLFGYAVHLYGKAMEYGDAKKYTRAAPVASVTVGVATFLAADRETPQVMRDKAIQLADAADRLLNDIRRAEREEYGEKYLSGSTARRNSEFLEMLCQAAEEANSD